MGVWLSISIDYLVQILRKLLVLAIKANATKLTRGPGKLFSQSCQISEAIPTTMKTSPLHWSCHSLSPKSVSTCSFYPVPTWTSTGNAWCRSPMKTFTCGTFTTLALSWWHGRSAPCGAMDATPPASPLKPDGEKWGWLGEGGKRCLLADCPKINTGVWYKIKRWKRCVCVYTFKSAYSSGTLHDFHDHTTRRAVL